MYSEKIALRESIPQPVHNTSTMFYTTFNYFINYNNLAISIPLLLMSAMIKKSFLTNILDLELVLIFLKIK